MLNKTKLFCNRLSYSFLLYYWPPENFEQKQTSRSAYRREYRWQLQSLLQCVMTGNPDRRTSRKNAVWVAKTISSCLCYSWLAKTIADTALEGFTRQKCLEDWLWNWVPKEQNKTFLVLLLGHCWKLQIIDKRPQCSLRDKNMIIL